MDASERGSFRIRKRRRACLTRLRVGMCVVCWLGGLQREADMLRGILAHTHAPVKNFITPIDKTYCVSMDVSLLDMPIYLWCLLLRRDLFVGGEGQWSPHDPFI